MIEQLCQKGDFIFGVVRIGAPLALKIVFEHQKSTQSAPKITPMVQKLPQNAPKITPRSQNGLLQSRKSGSSASKNVSCKIPGPADCAKRLHLKQD